jgi:hydroxyacylglutathione hydrolase
MISLRLKQGNAMPNIVPISAFNDNYIWILVSGKKAIVVDPGDATPVIDYLKQHELRLAAILVTHHHHDHSGGVAELIAYQNVPVYSAKNVDESSTIQIKNFPEFRVLQIPGHTLDHLAFYAEGILFCGDTLFSAGCGRVFEGTMEQMYTSLLKLKSLPVSTKIYCGHEYTLQNLKFAQAVEPNNTAIKNKILAVENLRSENKPSLPALLSEELQINPFLRCDHVDVILAVENRVKKTLTGPAAVFTALREWKNEF